MPDDKHFGDPHLDTLVDEIGILVTLGEVDKD